MINSRNRFHGQNGLRYVYHRGRTLRSKYLAMKYVVNPHRQDYRAAVVVSRKVSKSAPSRNRIRRRVYELIRQAAPMYLKNQDIVVTIFDEMVATMKPEELSRLINNMCREISHHSRETVKTDRGMIEANHV